MGVFCPLLQLFMLASASDHGFFHIMLEWFTETTGRQRLVYGLVGITINAALFFFAGWIWFWLWAVTIVLLLSSMVGEW